MKIVSNVLKITRYHHESPFRGVGVVQLRTAGMRPLPQARWVMLGRVGVILDIPGMLLKYPVAGYQMKKSQQRGSWLSFFFFKQCHV